MEESNEQNIQLEMRHNALLIISSEYLAALLDLPLEIHKEKRKMKIKI